MFGSGNDLLTSDLFPAQVLGASVGGPGSVLLWADVVLLSSSLQSGPSRLRLWFCLSSLGRWGFLLQGEEFKYLVYK